MSRTHQHMWCPTCGEHVRNWYSDRSGQTVLVCAAEHKWTADDWLVRRMSRVDQAEAENINVQGRIDITGILR